MDPLTIAMLASTAASIGTQLFGKKKKEPEAPTYRPQVDPFVEQARSQLYSKLFTSPVEYASVPASDIATARSNIGTEARKAIEGEQLDFARRGFIPSLDRTSALARAVVDIGGEEADAQADLEAKKAEINASNKIAAEYERLSRQLGFLGGQETRLSDLSKSMYGADLAGYEGALQSYQNKTASQSKSMETMGMLAALMSMGKGGGAGAGTTFTDYRVRTAPTILNQSWY